jgi:hypothetical protein
MQGHFLRGRGPEVKFCAVWSKKRAQRGVAVIFFFKFGGVEPFFLLDEIHGGHLPLFQFISAIV